MQPRNRRVLISGASVAGPVLACWLRRYGFEPTVVELAPTLRGGGYPIDVRGHAVTVADRMGVLPAIRAAGIDTAALSFADESGRERASVDLRAVRKASASKDIELLRGDLTRIVCAATDGADYRFGDRITALTEHADGVRAEFEHAPAQEFDLVLGADGVHSGVRGLAFGPERRFTHYLGCYFGGAEIDATRFGQQDRVVMRNTPGRTLGVYRFGDRAAAFFMFGSERPLDYDYRDPAAPRRLFAERFTGSAWPPGIIEAISTAEGMYFDEMSQVRMPTWSAGRVCLAGDAAHCPTLVTGAGTSLAMIGAYLLAGELHAAAGEHERAFAAYERRLRPEVTKAQRGTAQGIATIMPGSNAAIRRRDLLARLAFLQVGLARLTRPFSRRPELPDYESAVSAVSAVSSPPPARPRTSARASGRSGQNRD